MSTKETSETTLLKNNKISLYQVTTLSRSSALSHSVKITYLNYTEDTLRTHYSARQYKEALRASGVLTWDISSK